MGGLSVLYGRLKVTRGYPNDIRDNEHRDRISRDGNHESKTDDRKTRIPECIRGNKHRQGTPEYIRDNEETEGCLPDTGKSRTGDGNHSK